MNFKVLPGFFIEHHELEKLVWELGKTEPDFEELTRPRRVIRRAEKQKYEDSKLFRKAKRAAYVVMGKIAPPVKPHTLPDRPDKETIFIDSFEAPITGEETLFCDTDFLESFFRKPVKKAEECQGPGKE